MSWRVVKLGDLIESFSVKAKNYKDIDVSKLNFFGVSNSEGITISKYAAEDKANDYKIMEKGCFAYNPYRINVGSISMLKDDILGLISPAYVVFKVKENTIIPELLLKFLKSSEGLRQIKLHARGTVRQALRFSDLCQIKIFLPDYDEQKEFYKKISTTEIESSVLSSHLTHQLTLVKQLRQSFLREAMQGKLLKSSPPSKEGWPKAGVVEDKLNRFPQKEVVNKKINNLPYLKTFRKELRNNLTPAEAKLWTLLKGKQLEGRKFRRQFSVANYILDFYCPSENLAIELDGQGHFEASQAEYDYERDLFLDNYGNKVLRFENKWVWDNPEGLLEEIKRNFGWKKNDPSVLRTAPLEGEQLETGADLLAKIKAEKEQLIKEKKIRKPKPLPPITKDEIPFEIPDNWVWCRLGDLSYITSGSTPKSNAFVEKGIPYLKMYNLRNQKIDFFYKPQYIKEEVHNGQLKRCRAYPGDVIMNIVGPPLGKIAIIPKSLPECNFNQAAVMIRPIKLNMNKFIFWYLNEMSEIDAVETKGVAGQNNISVTQAHNMRIPLPPLSEQKRIVAKLDELMAYCDSLEASIKNSQAQNEMLLRQVLREALEPKEITIKEEVL